MALVIADRVRETTSSAGTGTITLTGAFLGFQAFSTIGNGNTTYYAIIDASTGDWEVGVGTYTASGNTLSRTTVLSSSNGGSLVSFAAGTKDVICTQPSERAVLLDSATNATIPGITLSGGTANGVTYLNGSKVLTSGSALTFDGTNLTSPSVRVGANLGLSSLFEVYSTSYGNLAAFRSVPGDGINPYLLITSSASGITFEENGSSYGSFMWKTNATEQMRLTSTGLGIGSSTSLGTKGKLGVYGTGDQTEEGTATATFGSWDSGGMRMYFGVNNTNEYTYIGSVKSNTGYRSLVLQPNGGNLGIGTSSPSTKLHVNAGASADTDVRLQAGASGNHAKHTYSDSANTVQWTSGYQSSTGYFRISAGNSFNTTGITLDSSGNLGLGVTPSAWAVLPAIQISEYGGLSAGGGYTRLSSNAYLSTYPNTWSYINTNTATLYEQATGQHRWFTAPSGTAGNPITFTQAMTLDASGRLLVGTTEAAGKITTALNSPGSLGTVVSVASFGANGVFSLGGVTNNNDGVYLGTGDAVTSGKIASGIGFLREGIGWNSAVAFYTNNATSGPNGVSAVREVARFDSSGKLTVGAFGATGRLLEVYGSDALLDGAGQFDLIMGDGGVAYMSLTTTDNATALKIRNYSGNSDIAVFERTTGNVGIGTSSPSQKLDVVGFGNFGSSTTAGQVTVNAVTGAGTQINWKTNGTQLFALGTNVGLGGIGDFSLYDYANATTAFVIRNGNLGLGVIPSANSVAKAFELQSGFNMFGFSNLGYINANAYYNGGWFFKNTAAAGRYEVGDAHKWFTAPSGTAGNAISFTQAMTLDASGNLGVGVTNPGNKLALPNNAFISFRNTSAAEVGYIGMTSSNLMSYSDKFYTDSSGNLLVGTTSKIGDGKTNVLFNGASAQGLNLQTTYADIGSGFLGFYNSAGSNIGSVQQAVGSTVIYNTTSDYRLKTVIGTVTGAGERIDALEPVEYEWKADGSRTRGFLAHQFQEVYAGSVTGTKDAVDAEGKPVYQAMQASTSEVIADLVAEIQSLRQRLAALEAA